MKQGEKAFIQLKDIIESIFATSAVPMNLDDVEIWRVWDDSVGKNIADHARPSWIKKGVLMVKVTDNVWLQELEFMTEKIRERLNSKLKRDAIKKIRFKVGTLSKD